VRNIFHFSLLTSHFSLFFTVSLISDQRPQARGISFQFILPACIIWAFKFVVKRFCKSFYQSESANMTAARKFPDVTTENSQPFNRLCRPDEKGGVT